MASLAVSARSRGVPFICDSCLSKLRPSCRTRAPSISSLHALRSAGYATTSRCTVSRTPTIRTPVLTAPQFPRTPKLPFRTYATTTTTNPPTEPLQKGMAPLPDRRLIQLSGADAAKFLQGLITNNVDPTKRESFYAAFLDARGRVLWDVFIWVFPVEQESESAEPWGCYIEVDATEVSSLLKHLKKHKLRSKISISLVPEEGMFVYASWGKARSNAKPPFRITDPRASGFGERFLLTEKLECGEDGALVDTEQYHLRRYLFGIPEGQAEIPKESALPMECNIDISSGIEFRKGCYIGQELTIRTKHTGVVRKRVLPVQLYHADEAQPSGDRPAHYDGNWSGLVEPGADIKQLDEQGEIKKGRATGKFIAAIGNVGLALCRLEMMTPMRVSAEGGPYKAGMEFGLQSSFQEADASREDRKIFRVKPIVLQDFTLREKIWWEKGRQKHVQ